MDQTRRLILFIVISTVVIFGWARIFPPPAPPAPTAADSAAVAGTPAGTARTAPPAAALAAPANAPDRIIRVTSPLYEYRFSTRGAALNAATLREYRSYVHSGESVQLVPRSARDVLARRVVVGRDTVDFRNVPFTASAASINLREGDKPRELTFVSANAGPVRQEITYTFHADGYLVDIRGRFTGAPRGAQLVTELGTGMAPHDAKDHGTARELNVVAWNQERVERHPLSRIQTPDTLAGPLGWAGIKDRYFLIALLNGDRGTFSRVLMEPARDVKYALGPDTLISPRARARTVQALAADGTFSQQAYLGPLQHARLASVGHQLEEVQPYGYRWLRPVVRPISAGVLWLLNAMHTTLGLHWGWVLIVFGFLVRLVTWPLNARAMRSQMKNMAVQPVLQERMKAIQAEHKDDPARVNREMMALYSELGVSPLSMMTGCVPMLIPMPVLITLFFVFQSAIEFRGEHFAWLPDLSLRDPFYILPAFLVLSMFGLQYASARISGMEQNEQARMMMYTMPLMMGFVFFAMPSGLNLYYAATNIASFPQQVLIAQERRRATEAQKAEKAAKDATKSNLRSIPARRRKK
ncbi:membrane protein insertase YidC [Longimicrobium terrae]|uniref:Membrane protein insertase YidC n=1 Tax=Longimicrobium terrae TaxID=1639882 RepID=A0A841GZW4_9BACT|nr:membrane protein insertase YidC [Longimicrobium terrae]MBB4636735.1 YidC/Oxa1 family membrane protein insertase [Longimicrobium terrae]MBB6071266.1 YidC/Oxa1 family membrane protein insertase [Longimicrobium terrae]NNC29312.1 membrane protein insertase YidC [Longimicrobium terrae]